MAKGQIVYFVGVKLAYRRRTPLVTLPPPRQAERHQNAHCQKGAIHPLHLSVLR